MVPGSCEFRVLVETPTPEVTANSSAIAHLTIVAAIDWKRKKVALVTPALLNQGAGKHYPSAGQAFGAINIHWGYTAPLFPRYPT